ncbi:MAG: L-2-hydroxyglutarate oxidase [Nitrospirota bacterium]
MSINRPDFLICGAGIIGLTLARELVMNGYENILIIEKEGSPGLHASGRNSGVLHACIYYTPESLRAKSCLHGNLMMRQYCKEKGLPLLETGKVIVSRNEKELETLKELHERAIRNGAKVELINERQLEEIEPKAKTCELALYSYYTAIVDPKAVLRSLYEDLLSSRKVRLLTKTEFRGIKGNNIAVTGKGKIEFQTFINAAGAYSDKIAHTFYIGSNYRLIPFKGIYRKLRNNKSDMVRGNIYPVPDIRNPFLGIHFTRNIKGEVYLGPTAIPAFGRENYGLIRGIDKEAFDIFLRDAMLFIINPKFRDLALTEPKNYIFKFFFKEARKLLKDLKPEDIEPSDKVGIRPQLVDWNKKELVMDFLVIKDQNSIHILNTISPGFTSSIDFARFIVKEYIQDGK